jgi:hypothetical protein
MRFVCQGCVWRTGGDNRGAARNHEADTQHRDALGETTTATLPRSFWTDKAPPTVQAPEASPNDGSIPPAECPGCGLPTWDGLHANGHRDCWMHEVES